MRLFKCAIMIPVLSIISINVLSGKIASAQISIDGVDGSTALSEIISEEQKKGLSSLEDLYESNVDLVDALPSTRSFLNTEATIARTVEGFSRSISYGNILSRLADAISAAITYTTGPDGRFADDIQDNYVQGMKDMAKEMTAVGAHAMNGIGFFFDADMQLDTQRLYQQLNAQAHKDYHPSEQMCQFGTFIRSVASTEEKGTINRAAINAYLMTQYNGKLGAVTASSDLDEKTSNRELDYVARIGKFKTTYCDPGDNSGGLKLMCGTGATNKDRINKDLDFTRTVGSQLTLDVDFSKDAATEDEEDIKALARNLYWPEPIPKKSGRLHRRDPIPFQDIRRIIAMNNVAHNSYAAIVAEKSAGEDVEDSGGDFMKALFKDFGLSDTDVQKMLGDAPSYYAQMDVLTKKMYQNPGFYTNLYDKPVNVRRMSVSMDAIKLIQSRDHYNASLRREMLLSMLVEREVSKKISKSFPAKR